MKRFVSRHTCGTIYGELTVGAEVTAAATNVRLVALRTDSRIPQRGSGGGPGS